MSQNFLHPITTNNCTNNRQTEVGTTNTACQLVHNVLQLLTHTNTHTPHTHTPHTHHTPTHHTHTQTTHTQIPTHHTPTHHTHTPTHTHHTPTPHTHTHTPTHDKYTHYTYTHTRQIHTPHTHTHTPHTPQTHHTNTHTPYTHTPHTPYTHTKHCTGKIYINCSFVKHKSRTNDVFVVCGGVQGCTERLGGETGGKDTPWMVLDMMGA
jgi:hypothetical protein